jgi:AAA domain
MLRRVIDLFRHAAGADAPDGRPSLPDAWSVAPLDLTHPMMIVEEQEAEKRFTRGNIHSAFNAALPVENRFGLAGRSQEIDRIAEGVIDQRKHAVIFGPRGSGKTSLAKVFGDLADEMGFVALYSSASGDRGFDALFRPFFAHLPATRAQWEALGSNAEIDPHTLADLLVETINRRTFLIIDEFDRIENPETKDAAAAFLKLLSDMTSQVQIVIVGIAANVQDLLHGHLSLRRHLVSQAVGPISTSSLIALIEDCCRRAGMTADRPVVETIATYAMGSPYHTRLFALHAALSAEREGSINISGAHVERGFASAVQDWASVSSDTYHHLLALSRRTDISDELIAASAVAAYLPALTTTSLAAYLDHGPAGAESYRRASNTIELLQPVLLRTGGEDTFMFRDTLAPQMLMLMAARQAASHSEPAATDSTPSLERDLGSVLELMRSSS